MPLADQLPRPICLCSTTYIRSLSASRLLASSLSVWRLVIGNRMHRMAQRRAAACLYPVRSSRSPNSAKSSAQQSPSSPNRPYGVHHAIEVPPRSPPQPKRRSFPKVTDQRPALKAMRESPKTTQTGPRRPRRLLDTEALVQTFGQTQLYNAQLTSSQTHSQTATTLYAHEPWQLPVSPPLASPTRIINDPLLRHNPTSPTIRRPVLAHDAPCPLWLRCTIVQPSRSSSKRRSAYGSRATQRIHQSQHVRGSLEVAVRRCPCILSSSALYRLSSRACMVLHFSAKGPLASHPRSLFLRIPLILLARARIDGQRLRRRPRYRRRTRFLFNCFLGSISYGFLSS